MLLYPIVVKDKKSNVAGNRPFLLARVLFFYYFCNKMGYVPLSIKQALQSCYLHIGYM